MRVELAADGEEFAAVTPGCEDVLNHFLFSVDSLLISVLSFCCEWRGLVSSGTPRRWVVW